jgi:hypothetical protein
MDINFWKTLPSQTCLILYLYKNNKKEIIHCKYFHCAENKVYLSYNLEEDVFCDEKYLCLIFNNGNVILNIETHSFSQGTILTSIKIKSVKKTNQLPLNFSFINKKYIDIISKNYKDFHLAHDYLDQGWSDIINGNDLEHLVILGIPLFTIDEEYISLIEGEDLWINDNCLPKLEELFFKLF